MRRLFIVASAVSLCMLAGIVLFWGLSVFLISLLAMACLVAPGLVIMLGLRGPRYIVVQLSKPHGLIVPASLDFPGFCVPVGLTRMLHRPLDYLALMSAADGYRQEARVLLAATASTPLSRYGLADEDFLRLVLRSNEPGEIVRVAAALADSHGAAPVLQHAQHPSGIARGLALLEAGVPYEYTGLTP